QHARQRFRPIQASEAELVQRRRERVELLLERGEERQAAGGGQRAHELQLDRREPVRVVDDDVVVGVVADGREAGERARDEGVRRLAAELARPSRSIAPYCSKRSTPSARIIVAISLVKKSSGLRSKVRRDVRRTRSSASPTSRAKVASSSGGGASLSPRIARHHDAGAPTSTCFARPPSRARSESANACASAGVRASRSTRGLPC